MTLPGISRPTYRKESNAFIRFEDATEPTPGGGYDTLYTVPANGLAVIELLIVTTLATPAVDVHLVPNGGAVGTDNAVVIGANPGVGNIPMRIGPYQLEAGGTLQTRNTAGAGNTANVRAWIELYPA